MLDTIILEFSEEKFKINNSSRFTVSPNKLKETIGFAKSYNNASATDKALDIYRPRLTLYKRGYELFLKVEFSAPKLLWRNNVDELCENDFGTLTYILKAKLDEVGVSITKDNIKTANVTCFHPSKNIPLCNGFTTSYVINELKKVDISRVYDLDEKDYRNGRTFQIYSNSFAFVFYDKVYDLNRPEKRSNDKSQTKYQTSLFDSLKTKATPLELLRLEIRLSKKKKMNEILEELGYQKNPSFEEIFKNELCKNILNHYWQKFFGKYYFLLSLSSSPQRLLSSILMSFPNIKSSQAVKWVGILVLMKDEEGIRGLRNALNNSSKNSWQVIKKQIERFKDKIQTNNKAEFITDIERELANFTPYKIN